MGKWFRKKCIPAFVLCFGMLLGFCNVLVVRAEETVEETANARRFTDEGAFVIDAATGIITKYNDIDVNNPQTEVIIPVKVNGVAVKGLAATFYGNEKIEKVIVPDTIITIGDNTFGGCVKFHALCVYDADKPLTKEAVTEAKKAENNSDNVWIDWSKYISMDGTDGVSFYEITDKGSCVIIPQAVTQIGQNVFNACSFNSFDVLEGNTAFCDSNEGGMNLAEGVGACLMSADKKYLYRLAPGFRDVNNSLTYSLPEGIEEILPYAIHKTGLQHVVVPATVKQIDQYAFYDSNLLGVEFAPNSQTALIGSWAFAYNANMDIILPPSVLSIGSYCFAYITNRTPDISKTNITVLPAYTFEGCPNLHTITMPASLLEIQGYAFAGSDNLNEVIFLGDRLNKIEAGAFQNCQNLHKIDIPEGVTAIEDNTFDGCHNLNEIILPDSLEKIGDNAFKDCQNIHVMVIPPNVTYISNSSFEGAKQDEIDTSKNIYSQKFIKGEFPKGSFIVGSLKYKVTAKYPENKSNALAGTVAVCGVKSKKIKKATIGNTVVYHGYTFKITEISKNAFKKCSKMTSVTIGTNVTKIGNSAFYGAKKLKKITIKSTKLKKVEKNAIKGIHKKATIKVPKKKLSKYKKLFKSKTGFKKSMKIKK